jgi:hypothetical protein
MVSSGEDGYQQNHHRCWEIDMGDFFAGIEENSPLLQADPAKVRHENGRVLLGQRAD